jgi:hypothetical protein
MVDVLEALGLGEARSPGHRPRGGRVRRSGRPRGRQPHDGDEDHHRRGPGPPGPPLAGMHRVEEVPDRDAHEEDEARDDPVPLGREGERIVVRQHQEHDRQRQVVVVGRPELRDLAVLRIGRPPRLEVGHHDLLVRDDDEEHVGRHDRRREGAEMEERRPPREDLVVTPCHHDEKREEEEHERGRAVAERRLAEEVVDDPAHRERPGRDQDRLPDREIGLLRVDQEQLRPRPVDDREERRARSHVA